MATHGSKVAGGKSMTLGIGRCQQTGRQRLAVLFLGCFVLQPWLDFCNVGLVNNCKVLNLPIYKKKFNLNLL